MSRRYLTFSNTLHIEEMHLASKYSRTCCTCIHYSFPLLLLACPSLSIISAAAFRKRHVLWVIQLGFSKKSSTIIRVTWDNFSPSTFANVSQCSFCFGVTRIANQLIFIAILLNRELVLLSSTYYFIEFDTKSVPLNVNTMDSIIQNV